MDGEMRSLERLLRAGDPSARERLAGALERSGEATEALRVRAEGNDLDAGCAYVAALIEDRELGEALLAFVKIAPALARFALSWPPTDLARARMRREVVSGVYEARRRGDNRPEGSWDNAKRWKPSKREDCGGSVSKVRAPSRTYPLSYIRRATTKSHAANLVEAGLQARDVPEDVMRAVCRLALHGWTFKAEAEGDLFNPAAEIPRPPKPFDAMRDGIHSVEAIRAWRVVQDHWSQLYGGRDEQG